KFKDQEDIPYVPKCRDHNIRKERTTRKKLRLEACQPRTKREAFEKAKVALGESEETRKQRERRQYGRSRKGTRKAWRKRDDQQEDEPQSIWYETTLASKEHDDEMRKSRGDLVVTEIRLERGQRGKRTESMERGMMSETFGSSESNQVDGGPTIGIPDKGENRLNGHDKIIPVDTIEPIKKKEGLRVDNGVQKNQYNTIQPTSREPDGNGVMLVPTSDIMITSYDDPEGRSKKENGKLVINGTRYWNTDGLTMKRPKANRDKTEYEMEGEIIFVSMWEPCDPEDSRNDNVTEKESTNDAELDTTVGVPINHQDDGEEVVLVPTSVITIVSCDDSGEHDKKTNRGLVSSGMRHGDTDELTGGRSDTDRVGLGRVGNEGGAGSCEHVETRGTRKQSMATIGEHAPIRVHCAMMITIMTVLMSNRTVLKSESTRIVRHTVRDAPDKQDKDKINQDMKGW
ncbi:12766_t:CDS:2, partial [Acaulospora morrowiae]